MHLKKTVSFSVDAVNVFFHILTQCNLKCEHCYINPKQHGDNKLSLNVIENWLSILKEGRKDANLVLLGGEPTLHPELPTIISIARQMGYATITLDTNGYLFHDILSKVSPEDVDCFSFSLDGATEKTNDRIRGKGCFGTCMAGMKQAAERGFQTSLIYTVSRRNIHELTQMGPILADAGVGRFFIQVIGLRGKSALNRTEGLHVSREKWLETVPPAAEKIAAMGIRVIYPKVFLRRDEPFQCAGRVASNFFVFPNGRVYRCPLCEDYPLHGFEFKRGRLEKTAGINETRLFGLDIPEGCVMNKLIQPENIAYHPDGTPEFRIACCLLKEEIF
ncbi:MAG: radical SAM protein [Desulfobacterales bacterium]